MPETRIIRATVADLDALTPLFDAYRRFYQQPEDTSRARRFLKERLGSGDSVVFLALIGGDAGETAAGFAQLYPIFSSVSMYSMWIINDLFVDPAHRESGIGRMLMERAVAHGRETGAGRVTLETASDNATARALYESMGFVAEHGFEHYALRL